MFFCRHGIELQPAIEYMEVHANPRADARARLRERRRAAAVAASAERQAAYEAARQAERAVALAAATAPGAALAADDDVDTFTLRDDTEVADDAADASWGTALHHLFAIRELTEDDPRAPTPAGFRGELYLPQQTMLAAMVALERHPYLQLNGAILQTSAARIAAQFSFGKTVLALALICARPAAQAAPLTTAMQLAPMIGAMSCPSAGKSTPSSGYFVPEATMLYEAVLPFTVVAAAANVISQWEANAAQFTTLRTFTVENVHSLRAFETHYRTGRLNYDVVFVKAGRVTTSFAVAGEAPLPAATKARSMFEALSRVLDGEIVARLIVDDYDTLKLSSDDCFLPAQFTWLVSATRRTTQARISPRHDGPAPSDSFAGNAPDQFPVLGAALDDVLNGCCSLRCAPDYVGAHISSLQVGFRRIRVRGGRAAGILRDLDLAPDILEMVHADAVGTAAAALGIEASSVGDIVQRLVGTHLGRLRAATRTQARCARVRAGLALATESGAPLLDRVARVAGNAVLAMVPAAVPAVAPAAVPAVAPAMMPAMMPVEPDPTEPDPRTVGGLKRALREGSDAQFTACWNSPLAPEAHFDQILKDLEVGAAEVIDKYGKTLNRMRDNIREGYCQVCTVPFERGAAAGDAGESDAAYVLAGCCQIIVCEMCVTKRVGGARQFISRCPNCAVDVRPGAGLIRVGAELDLEAALGDEALQSVEADVAGALAGAPAADALTAAPAAEIANTKLRALVQFIKQEPIECMQDTPVAAFVHGLLSGPRSVPLPADAPRFILVFAMHPESTRLIEFALGLARIPYGVLRGARAQKDAAIEALRSAPAGGVLLVTAAKDCAGIHMPWLTHIVFYHRVADPHVEAQVTARGQRLGRTHDLEVVVIANEGER